MKTIIALLLIAASVPASANERCHNMAAMYLMAFQMRTLSTSDESLIDFTRVYVGFSDHERQRAVDRVRPTGDLGMLSANTIYRHVYLECTHSK